MKLFVAVPSHSGSVVVECLQTIVAVQKMVISRGGSFELVTEGGALIGVVRNVLAARFLQSDADLMLMLDSDQSASPETIERMIDLDKPVVGCIYPKRRYDWSKVTLDNASKLDSILYQASEFVGWLEEDGQGISTVVNGFAKAVYVGTGILLLQRTAFQKLMADFPELKGSGFGQKANPQHAASGRWGFFNMIADADGVQISEDISFCERWRKSGGEIWAEVAGSTTHVGRYQFKGNYLDFLAAKGLIGP